MKRKLSDILREFKMGQANVGTRSVKSSAIKFRDSSDIPNFDPLTAGQASFNLMNSLQGGVSSIRSATLNWVNKRSEHLVKSDEDIELIVNGILNEEPASSEFMNKLNSAFLVDGKGIVHKFTIDENNIINLIEGANTTEVGYIDGEDVLHYCGDEGRNTLENLEDASDLLVADSLAGYDFMVDCLTSVDTPNAIYNVISTGMSSSSASVQQLAAELNTMPTDSIPKYIATSILQGLSGLNDVEFDDETNSFSIDDYTPAYTSNILASAWSVVSTIADVALSIALICVSGIGKVIAGAAWLVCKALDTVFNKVDASGTMQIGTGRNPQFSNGGLFYGKMPTAYLTQQGDDVVLQASRSDSAWGSIMHQTSDSDAESGSYVYDKFLVYPNCGDLHNACLATPYGYNPFGDYNDDSHWWSLSNFNDMMHADPGLGYRARFILGPDQRMIADLDTITSHMVSDVGQYDYGTNPSEFHVKTSIMRNIGTMALLICKSGFRKPYTPGHGITPAVVLRNDRKLSDLLLICYKNLTNSSHDHLQIEMFSAAILIALCPFLWDQNLSSYQYLNNIKSRLQTILTWNNIESLLSRPTTDSDHINSLSYENFICFTYCLMGHNWDTESLSDTEYGYYKYVSQAAVNSITNLHIKPEIMFAVTYALRNLTRQDFTFSQRSQYWTLTDSTEVQHFGSDVSDCAPFNSVGDDPCVITDPAVTPPSTDKRAALWALALSFIVIAAAVTVTLVTKKKRKRRRLAKAVKKEQAAIEAQQQYLADPSEANMKNLYKKQRKFQRYANRVGYSSNSMASFNSTTGVVEDAVGNSLPLNDSSNDEFGSSSTLPLYKAITGRNATEDPVVQNTDDSLR